MTTRGTDDDLTGMGNEGDGVLTLGLSPIRAGAGPRYGCDEGKGRPRKGHGATCAARSDQIIGLFLGVGAAGASADLIGGAGSSSCRAGQPR